MNRANVPIQIPFSSLLEAVSHLSIDEKRQLWQQLDAEVNRDRATSPWQPLFDSLEMFSDDFMETREQPQLDDRQEWFD